MLGEEEKKHIAIAAACGAAIGAVVGAVGALALSHGSSTSGVGSNFANNNRSNSQIDSPDGAWAASLASDTGESDVTKALKELTLRMESLEQAVSTKLLSRSGSSVGYITAGESPSEEEKFEDADEQSSDDEIYFHSLENQHRIRQRRLDSGIRKGSKADTSAPNLDNAAELIDYTEIDRCLCCESTAENAKGFDLLNEPYTRNEALSKDPQFLWRFAKATHQKGLSASDPDAKQVHAFRAKELAFQALDCAEGPNFADVHKWCAITIGNIGDYVSLQEKISNGCIFKERIDSAIALCANDEMSYYLLGRWCYSIYMMTWVERKVANTLVSGFPSATIDEALTAFQNSERLKPGYWIDNQLYLAKCYIEKKDYSTAMSWLDKAELLPVKPEV